MDVRAAIIEDIRTRLGMIVSTSTNDRYGLPFKTDIGRNVVYGRVDTPAPQDCPGVNFADGSEDANKEYGRNAREMMITVETYEYDRGREVISLANSMLDDVDSVLLYDDGELKQKLKGLCYEVRFISKDPFELQGDLPLCGAILKYLVIFDP